MKHIVSFSGGLGSWMAAKRVAERYGTEDLILLFANTLMEDEDLYRFLQEAAENVGGDFIGIEDGRHLWEVFRDERILNHRLDPCSRILKRDLLDRWVRFHYTPDECIRYVGIDWTEEHRLERMIHRFAPYKVEAPLCDPPYLSKQDIRDCLAAEGIELPRLYRLGFPHNNCGGFCIKAGQAQFALLLRTFPDRYRYHEEKEQELIAELGDGAYILRDRRGGITKPLTLRAFRERLEATGEHDKQEWGGCGCGV